MNENEGVRIVGIDPGLRNTGWGIIESQGPSIRFLASGTVKSDQKNDLASRLCELYDGLLEVILAHQPAEAAVESIFVNKDAVATLKLGHARGIALLVPARTGLTVAEYAPTTVKKTVIGGGHGTKEQIKLMITMLLPKASYDSDDAADALAVAICHSHHRAS
ncbi:crossover junction endodeoxyribonuclease RuvC [Candidatus Endowatersipora endosymbiont of Watersipora subatra]|uniref:crossover junction endodeoxyribonuclease RuvC n=1 Tax=Candidatus Endowatersipora endosymbiont of Watersipora subatra TaxID=3077946 RepID=UPI00312CA3EC